MAGSTKPEHETDEHNVRNPEIRTPGAVGHPEPGSGHDDSETTTVDDGPPIEKTGGVPGASGDVETERRR
jgi:hypothetical protein